MRFKPSKVKLLTTLALAAAGIVAAIPQARAYNAAALLGRAWLPHEAKCFDSLDVAGVRANNACGDDTFRHWYIVNPPTIATGSRRIEVWGSSGANPTSSLAYAMVVDANGTIVRSANGPLPSSAASGVKSVVVSKSLAVNSGELLELDMFLAPQGYFMSFSF